MAVVQIARNSVIAKIVNPTQAIVGRAVNLLSYISDAGIGFSGKSSFYDLQTNTFPAGFTYTLQQELQQSGHQVQIIRNPLPSPLGPENPIVDEFGNDDPRYDYQLQALRQVEKHGAGIIQVATGGGKSKIAKLVIERYRRMTLFLTTRGVLLYQMNDQLLELGRETGIIGDGQMQFSAGVNLGMVQTLVQSLEETSVDRELRALVRADHLNKGKSGTTPREDLLKQAQQTCARRTKRRDAILRFLSMVEVVIGEEAHEVGGTSYFEILRHCKNANIRVALTATPFMRANAEDNMRLMAAFGPKLIEITEKMLIDRGILAKPYFVYRNAEKPEKLYKSSPYERAIKLGYTENEHMMRLLTKDALMAKERGLPVLTLVMRKAHGEAIQKFYAANGVKAVFLKGEDDQAGRRKALRQLREGEIDAIIGTTILDVGVDVPAIGLVQLAGGGKAEVALRQRVGRGLRAKKSGPNIAFIADYSCNFNSTLWEHARQREAIIRATPGFAEGIVLEHEDLPWHHFPVKEKEEA